MHDPANNGCPKNADPRNETCACAEADERGGSAVGRAHLTTAKALAAGESRIVSDEFLDWLANTDPALACKVKTVPNPSRVGILDAYVATLSAPLLRLTADEGWKAWKVLMSRPTEQVRKLRREVTNQVLADHPGLEELGSSDVNCYAVSYLEARDLLVTDPANDGRGWQWSKDYLCECGRHKLSCATVEWRGLPHEDR